MKTYLIVLTIVLIIQLLGILLRVSLGLLAVNVIRSLGLRETINFDAGETREELFGELVGYWLACKMKWTCKRWVFGARVWE